MAGDWAGWLLQQKKGKVLHTHSSFPKGLCTVGFAKIKALLAWSLDEGESPAQRISPPISTMHAPNSYTND
jgi:hypothetical protein